MNSKKSKEEKDWKKKNTLLYHFDGIGIEEQEMEKMLEKEMGWKEGYTTEMCICMELNDNTLLETWEKHLHTEKMTIPLVPKNVMESLEVGKEITIPKKKIEQVENFYIEFIDENKISWDEYYDMVIFGVLPKKL
jgi:hypothetical protein